MNSGEGGRSACLAQLVEGRRSVRGFLAREVPREVIRDVFDLARFAPSNCNTQPWITHVVSGDKLVELREAMSQAAMRGEFVSDFPMANAYPEPIYRERQISAARVLYEAMGIERHDKEGRAQALARNFTAFDAPHAAFLFMDETMGMQEAAACGMYAQIVMLGLEAHGIASCAQGALSQVVNAIRGTLGIAESNKMLFALAFGFEDASVPANAARTGRAELGDQLVFHD